MDLFPTFKLTTSEYDGIPIDFIDGHLSYKDEILLESEESVPTFQQRKDFLFESLEKYQKRDD